MKHQLLSLIGIVFMVVSCQQSEALQHNRDLSTIVITQTPLSFIAITPEHSALLDISNGSYGLITKRLSPNGRWWYEWDIAESAPLPMDLQFTDLLNHNKFIDYHINNDDNKYGVVLQSWSPDSQFLVAYEGDNPGQCSNRIVLYRLDADNDRIEPITLEPPNHGASCIDYSWSPDNSQIAVLSSINRSKIFIFDLNGNLIQIIPISLSENEIVIRTTLYWTPAGIAYLVSQDDKGQQYELRLLNLETYEEKVLLAGNSTYIQAVNPFGWPKVLIEEYSQLSHGVYSWQLFIYDMDANEKKQMLDLPINRICCIKDSSVVPYTAILIPLKEDPHCADSGVLWFYNWEDDELFEYGEINELLGWFDSQNGFLISNLDEDLAILQPTSN